MANIGPMEIVVVLIVALVVFGPKRLPELGKSLGKGIHEFKDTISGESTHEDTPPAVAAAPAVAPVAVAPAPVVEPVTSDKRV